MTIYEYLIRNTNLPKNDIKKICTDARIYGWSKGKTLEEAKKLYAECLGSKSQGNAQARSQVLAEMKRRQYGKVNQDRQEWHKVLFRQHLSKV